MKRVVEPGTFTIYCGPELGRSQEREADGYGLVFAAQIASSFAE